MENNVLCLAGDGWGAIAAYNSLKNTFSNIELITNDDVLLKLKKEDHKRINSFNCSTSNYAICAGYKPIISKEELSHKTFINIHYSLLPKYRGASPIQSSIINGDKETGVTTMYMNEGMDTGDMIFQEKTSIGENETGRGTMEETIKYRC